MEPAYSSSTIMRSIEQSLACWATGMLLMLSVSNQVHAQFLPDLAPIKAAAEQGDSQAQSKLGDAYQASFEYSQSEQWYRRAAEKGNAHAQHRLGEILLTGRPPIKPGATRVPASPEEAVNWFSRAANQGHTPSQIALGQCYRDEKGVKKDPVEAYKWFSLAAKDNAILGKVYRDQLILKMSTQEIVEGDNRVASFKPGAYSTSPYLSMLVLKGVTGTQQKRMAIINNVTFAGGEEGSVKTGTKTLKIKCVVVRERSVVVRLVETGEQTELQLQ